MSTSASLVVGGDGSTVKNHSSLGVSTPADRTAFLARRREFDVILIGGNTARNEGYRRTPCPLVIISHSEFSPVPENKLAHVWNLSPAAALKRACEEFGERILIEAGVAIINELLAEKLIDEFFLSVTPVRDGENIVDWRGILAGFSQVEKSEIDGTLFFYAHN